MDNVNDDYYDVIVIGSGTCGATIARELSKDKKKVLILERGGNVPLGENLWRYASILSEVQVTDKLKDMRACTTGGSTAMYFAVSELPPLDEFRALGIDISQELEEVRKEIPLAELSDELITPQAMKLKESAEQLGYSWKKKLMMIDQSKANSGYSYEAKWKAKSFIEEAISNGATLINHAIVSKVIFDKKRAVGVEYRKQRKTVGHDVYKVYGRKIILAAGSLASPVILKESGIKNVMNRGFYLDPSIGMIGSVSGLEGKEGFCGSMGAKLDENIDLIDANFNRFLFNVGMFVTLKFSRIASYSNHIALIAKTKDAMGGELSENGRFYKKFTDSDLENIKKGENVITKILENAGARRIFSTGVITGGAFGTLKIQEHVDNKFQTEYENLYVCDGSLLLENKRVNPTLTLICLAKYLAKNLIISL